MPARSRKFTPYRDMNSSMRRRHPAVLAVPYKTDTLKCHGINMSISLFPAKSVTVSIVSHGHLEMVSPLLAQLETFSHAHIESVVLTLNIPEACPLPDFHTRFQLKIIKNKNPKGFGANHNQAFDQCKTPFFLVLNPDVCLDGDVFQPLINLASTDIGLLSPRIMEPGNNLPEPHRGLITPIEILSRKRLDYPAPKQPAWIPGLFMLFRTIAFRQIKGFDEKFFMYGEDFDICARVKMAGWQIGIAENLRVLHDARRASHVSRQHLWWHISSLFKVWTSTTFWRYRALLSR